MTYTPEQLDLLADGHDAYSVCTYPAKDHFAAVCRELAALRRGLEAVVSEPDDTQWWPVQPYMDPPNDDEVVEVHVVDAARIRALLDQ